MKVFDKQGEIDSNWVKKDTDIINTDGYSIKRKITDKERNIEYIVYNNIKSASGKPLLPSKVFKGKGNIYGVISYYNM